MRASPGSSTSIPGEEVLALVGHDSVVWSLAFSSDGRQLAGAGLGLGRDTLVWDVSAAGIGEVINYETPYSSFRIDGVRYSADGKSILLIAENGNDSTLARIDADTGETLVALSEEFSAGKARPPVGSRRTWPCRRAP
jgi:WD40 repeat protein